MSGPATRQALASGPAGPADLAISPKLQLRGVGRKGRGIFAAVPIAARELLEVAPTATLDRHDTETIIGTTFDNYYFAHPVDPDRGLLVFGLASLINHADEPNTETTPRHEHGLGWLLELRALRDIAAGEELTRRYACELWFEPDPPAASEAGAGQTAS